MRAAATPPPPLVVRSRAPSFAGIDELGELSAGPDDTDDDTDDGSAELRVTACGLTHVGMVRTNNEDALLLMDVSTTTLLQADELHERRAIGPRGLLLAVSDGMGGANAGEVASALTLETLERCFAIASSAPPDTRLAEAVEDANVRVVEEAEAPGRDGMGATLVAMLIVGTTAYSVEVGDSRAYVLRRGSLTQITKDQTQIQILLDQGLLTPEAAKTSRARNIVLQAIGKTPELIVAQRRLELRDGDRILLCSDGLTGHLADAEIAEVLAVESLAQACATLVEMTNERGGRDNVTVLAVEIGCAARPDDGKGIPETLTTTRAFSFGE